MLNSIETQRRIGLGAWVLAWVGLVVGQLHALSRFATLDGQKDLELPLTAAWAEPAADFFDPALGWASPDTVYLTYGKVWFPVLLALTLCALVVRHRRQPQGFEKWAWRVAIPGYAVLSLGVFLDYWTQLSGYNAFLTLGWFVTVPGLVLTLIGSTLLGIALLLRRSAPVVVPLLLALHLPLALAILQVTSLGSVTLPVIFAFGILGRRISREPHYQSVVPEPSTGISPLPNG